MINIDKLEYKRIQTLLENAIASGDPQKITTALNAIAEYYGITLPTDIAWLYMDTVQINKIFPPDEDGNVLIWWSPANGWSPRGDETDLYDENGVRLNAKSLDNYSIITRKTLEECGLNLSCIGAYMAHEAVHSRIEYHVEHTPGAKFDDTHEYLEEMVANQAALKIGNVTAISNNLANETRACIREFGESACSNPLLLVADAYGY